MHSYALNAKSRFGSEVAPHLVHCIELGQELGSAHCCGCWAAVSFIVPCAICEYCVIYGQLSQTMEEPMEEPYLLVTCVSTGSTWSEQVQGMAFKDYMDNTFGTNSMVARPIAAQEAEFCCGYPIGHGPNCLYKSIKACPLSITAESPRIVLSVRGIMSSNDWGEFKHKWSDSGQKFWIALRVPSQDDIPNRWSNDRMLPKRRRPEEITQFLNATYLATLRKTCQKL